MKMIYVTDAMYEQLQEIADERDQAPDIIAGVFIGWGFEVDRKHKAQLEEINKIRAETEFYRAALDSPDGIGRG